MLFALLLPEFLALPDTPRMLSVLSLFLATSASSGLLSALPVAVFFVFLLRFPMGNLSGCHVGRNHMVYRKESEKIGA